LIAGCNMAEEIKRGTVERLDNVLLELQSIWKYHYLEDQTQLLMLEKGKEYVATLSSSLKHSQVQCVVKLVQNKEWLQATSYMLENYQLAVCSKIIEPILMLVYKGNDLDNLTSAIKWVDTLDVSLRPGAFVVLYERIKTKKHTDQPQVLLLWRRIKDLPNLDDVRAQLEKYYQRIMESGVEGVLQMDYSLGAKIFPEDVSILKEAAGHFVERGFDGTLESWLLLIQFSKNLTHPENQVVLMEALTKALVNRSLLDSEHALTLYVHVKDLERNWRLDQPTDFSKLYLSVLQKLEQHKDIILKRYQKYVDDKDKNKIKHLHEQNPHLLNVSKYFVEWYVYNRVMELKLNRLVNLLQAAKAIQCPQVVFRLLVDLDDMVSFYTDIGPLYIRNQIKNFDSPGFQEKYASWLHETDESDPFEAPKCFRQILDEQPMRMVNKFFGSSLCVQQQQVICCNSLEAEQQGVFGASVDPNTALITFTIELDGNSWELKASAEDGIARVAKEGTKWMLKTEDQRYIKIFTAEGKVQFFFLQL
jgi:hypothetical protein